MPESSINVVEPSPHDPAKAYFAAAGYKMNDFTPYLFRTNDYGRTWEKIVNGIPGNTFARSIREDPDLIAVLSQLDLEKEIPAELYKPIAEILSFVYRVNEKARDPTDEQSE